ncbi:MAG: 3-hydroxyacyl-CoA dehydrogenase NAD-binding domain-containing protein [Candidatus Bathyarchaeota archaeon]|nr:3-hydroxyacyl-CoA dehydrogenase NAD-binding domain-containing protein [Candidatus Bathyarchaeota archaeon]
MKRENLKIGVVGAGTMGHGIAQVCASKGYAVTLTDVNQDALNKGLNLVRRGPFGLEKLVSRGKIAAEQVDEIMNRIDATTSYDHFCKDLGIVIEAIPESLELKKKLFKLLDEKCSAEAIFASNTSGIMITELAAAVERKEKLVGMHWFNPPPVMPLIEVVRGPVTSQTTFSLVMELSRKLGKTPIEVNDGPGFYTTRFIAAYLFEAIRLFEAGISSVEDIDAMTKLAFRHPQGPFELMDLIGLDTMLHIGEYIYSRTADPRYKPPLALRKLVLSGYLGDARFKPNSKGGWLAYHGRRK